MEDELLLWDFLILYIGEHGLAGFIGAMGNQVLYWGNRLRGRTPIRARILIFSGFYVVTGSGVGHCVGLDDGSTLIALSAGFGWPIFIKSIDAAKQIAQRYSKGGGASETAPEAKEG